MRNFSFEPLILLVIFILIPLANYVLERMRRRFEQQKPVRQPLPDMGFRRQAAPAPTPVSHAPPRERAPQAPPEPMLTASRRGWSRKTLFRTRREVRRVIVAMTVLGPCRAYDPPD
jgi:hypothetical protein